MPAIFPCTLLLCLITGSKNVQTRVHTSHPAVETCAPGAGCTLNFGHCWYVIPVSYIGYAADLRHKADVSHRHFYQRGLPLIMYASRGGGGGGVNTNAYKCVQGGRGGLSMTKNTHFVRRFIENATICGCCSIRIYNH